MNVLVVGYGPFLHPQWFEALRGRYANAGIFTVNDSARGMELLGSGIDIDAVVIGLLVVPDEVILEAERLCGATIDSGAPLPWIIAVRDGCDDAQGLLALRQRGVNVATDQDQTLQLLDSAWARGVEPAAVPPVAEAAAPDEPRPTETPPPVGTPFADAAERDMSCKLTPRQSEVLRLVNQGKSNKEIARVLDLAEGTVKVHCKAIFRVLGVANRTQAAVLIAKAGFDPVAQAGG